MKVNSQDYKTGPGMSHMKLAHAYVPFQRYTTNYPPQEALMKGTYFPDLYMPYRPGQRGYY